MRIFNGTFILAPPILITSNTRPPTPSKASRKLRFAELTPDDVHVYESAPVSPKRKALALPPPPDAQDPSILSLGTFDAKGLPRKRSVSLFPEGPKADKPGQRITDDWPQPEEGTPEYIRRRYFPDVPADDPSTSWMKPSSSNSEPVSLRFDLTGAPIPAEISVTLPSHLGLHHHADGDHAGYTLDDIFLLSRSTVPAQRTTMLNVLVGIARRLGKQTRDPHCADRVAELQGREGELRKRILAAGLSAMYEKGGVGIRAIEVVWECLVGWDPLFDADHAELDLAPAIMYTLDVPIFLSQVTQLLTQSPLPPESQAQLLSIVYRLSQESCTIAESIMTTPRLLPALLQTFLLTPIPPPSDAPLPNPTALQLLITLASSSRANAVALCEPADALLRFVTMLPPTLPFPEPLATTLLTLTLHLYATLASYGLYSHIATAAASYFTALSTFVISSSSKPLKVAWAGLVEAWIVCATNPHHTTPPHDILWSQVASWGWGVEVLELRQGITEVEVWTATWGAASAWLEGARVNGIRGGEGERTATLSAIEDDFNTGAGGRVVGAAMDALRVELAQIQETSSPERYQRLRRIGINARVLSSAVRLWLACTPIANANAPLGAPPFNLPFAELSSFSAFVVSHPLWSLISKGIEQAACRSLSSFLAYFHRLSRHIPGTSPDLWVAQGLTILRRLLPGDEDHALYILEAVLIVLGPQFLGAPAFLSISEKGGWDLIKPFLNFAIRPNQEVYLGPSELTPESIMRCTTLRLPPSRSSIVLDEHSPTGLPLSSAWLTSPIDHLLRSGSSPVFKALPSSWDASEVDVVRTSLLLVNATQDVLFRYSLSQFVIKRSEMIFACMKVFMLEHGQDQIYSSPATGDEEEVFRDSIVSGLMSDLLAPFTLRAASSSPSSILPDIDLEQAALPFLRSEIPFYQFYADFLGLYDAISFSHPIFASLLIPPLALTYPIDYRRLLLGDFAHVLRTVRTPVDQVIAGNLSDFLYPTEQGEMIGKYAGVLLQGSVDEFLRLVAVHHVACNIWPDLWSEGVGLEQQDAAKKLLKVVMEKGDGRTVREVLRYRQVRGEAISHPPACFEASGEWIKARAEFACQVLGGALYERLEGVFRD